MQNIMPILFNTPMVRAILGGRKTTTRRVMKPKCRRNFIGTGIDGKPAECRMIDIDTQEIVRHVERPYQPGNTLYVRETYADIEVVGQPQTRKRYYRADGNYPDGIPWRPSIFMPREAARIFLRVTDVRAERLQDITEGGAKAEGELPDTPFADMGYQWSAVDNFKEAWDKIIKKFDRDKYGWNANPWVWVIEFERCEKP